MKHKNGFDMLEKTVNQKIKMINLSQLEVSSAQPRIYFEENSIKELAQSLKDNGVLQPLIVRKNLPKKFEIIAGERRYRAAIISGLKKIPCIIMDLADEEALSIALIENLQRKDLNPIEEALAYQRLIQTLGISHEEVAKKVAKDRVTVSNSLRLLRLPEEVQKKIIGGALSMGQARALLSLNSKEEMIFFAEKVIREGLSVREVERQIKNFSLKKVYANKEKEGASILLPLEKAVQERLRDELGTKVVLKKEGNGFIMEVYYSDVLQLNGILERLGINL